MGHARRDQYSDTSELRMRPDNERGDMCYPCVNCGKCGQEMPEKVIRCPKCKTILTEDNPACSDCGWRLPLPPGTKDGDLEEKRG